MGSGYVEERLRLSLTLLWYLSPSQGEGEESLLKGLRPFNLTLIYGGWVFKKELTPLLGFLLYHPL